MLTGLHWRVEYWSSSQLLYYRCSKRSTWRLFITLRTFVTGWDVFRSSYQKMKHWIKFNSWSSQSVPHNRIYYIRNNNNYHCNIITLINVRNKNIREFSWCPFCRPLQPPVRDRDTTPIQTWRPRISIFHLTRCLHLTGHGVSLIVLVSAAHTQHSGTSSDNSAFRHSAPWCRPRVSCF